MKSLKPTVKAHPTAYKPKVTVIPAIKDNFALNTLTPTRKRRVAAYARVSTDNKEQLTSYDAQVRFYTEHIKSNLEWEFVGVYADEGITGVNTKKRDEFNRMVDDALAGKIDFIITKSISRFARNTVDSLVTVRKLKEKGVEIYFEKENIYTLDSKGELMITIMSSIAQEESHSISENVKWGHRKRMADGKVTMIYKHFLGYEKGADGKPQIVEREAKTVRLIYDMFLDGNTYREIAIHLTNTQIPTPADKTKWYPSTVKNILTNEKYAGNAILQKMFTSDFLTKTIKINNGELPQYFVKDSHPAIVTIETFELVQGEVQRRNRLGKRLSSSNPFACRIVCGTCGGFYGRKIWDHGSKYQRVVWQCNHKYSGSDICQNPFLTEDEIKTAFVTAFNCLIASAGRLVPEYRAKMVELADNTGFDEKTARLEMEYAETVLLAEALIQQNARTAQNQEDFNKELESLRLRSETVKSQLAAVKQQKVEQAALREKLRRFLHLLNKAAEPLTVFDESAWKAAVESVTVRSLGNITVVFRSGTEIKTEVVRG